MSNTELPLVFDKEVPEDSILMVDVTIMYRNGKTGAKSSLTVFDVVMKPCEYKSNVSRAIRNLPAGIHPIRLEATIKTSTK